MKSDDGRIWLMDAGGKPVKCTWGTKRQCGGQHHLERGLYGEVYEKCLLCSRTRKLEDYEVAALRRRGVRI